MESKRISGDRYLRHLLEMQALDVSPECSAIHMHSADHPPASRRIFSRLGCAAWPAHVSSAVAQFLWAASLNYRGVGKPELDPIAIAGHSLPLVFAGCRFATSFLLHSLARRSSWPRERGHRFTECCSDGDTHGDTHGDTRSRHVPPGHSLTDVQTRRLPTTEPHLGVSPSTRTHEICHHDDIPLPESAQSPRRDAIAKLASTVVSARTHWTGRDYQAGELNWERKASWDPIHIHAHPPSNPPPTAIASK
ncbi:hypothetical protein MKX08_009698 [Trichoderma sp. CBMAI-0020]|nr:hypothetical protein MKX08_009698 [Trichoderma sp. CBMAI-0020]